ncbi:UvrABC system A [Gossypium arboreum]|uniref:UvrABC system A n=1 Tax=Gossypium arboreum TaxID=29729 RepID=A0A0B0NS96_GOSAR|nr:UvrABC system A [Gossypium arboreum]
MLGIFQAYSALGPTIPSACLARNWCSSGCKTMCLSQDYHEVEPVNSPSSSSSSSTTAGTSNKLKLLWVKFKKEKMKIFESPVRVPRYDPHTYSQNFDHGFTWDEPENLSRSFSVRFIQGL